MIYQVGIGEFDNCYIITGGITGLSSFEPTLINSNSEAISIIIDKKDENIFTPWIKQSLKVNLLKENESDYAEIIAGDDNTTYGILIENGELELVSGNLRITDGGKLKFIGTLALESYSEQYRAVSVVQFTFYDRIGILSDEDFATNTQYKSVVDIIACCCHSIMCSKKMFLEWPYTLSSSDDPSEIFLELSDFDEKTNLEVLEQLMYDYGLQLKVDFEYNAQTNLVDCGAIRIISVTNHPEQFITYWEFDLDSFVASSCLVEYFTYTGTKNSPEYKNRELINTTIYPILNNETVLSLERVASSIIAKNEINLLETLVFRGELDFKFTKEVTGTRPGSIAYKYCPFGYLHVIENYPVGTNPYDLVKELLDLDDLSSIDNPIFYTRPSVLVPFTYRPYGSQNTIYNFVICRQLFINYSLFNSGNYKLKIKYSAYAPSEASVSHLSILMKKGSNYYINNSNSWELFTSIDQLDYNQYTIGSMTEETNEYDLTITSTGDDVLIMPILNCTIGSFELTEIAITPVIPDGETMPASINLTTELSGNNRKNIEINQVFLNAPNVLNGELYVKNTIRDIDNNLPFTIDYKSLSQTLLAHLSDQYGWQYNGNRWNIDGTAKAIGESFNLMGQFGLDEKVLILLSGEYDARRKELKGKWGQVLEIEENQYRLLQDNFIPFTWDDGNYIMLN